MHINHDADAAAAPEIAFDDFLRVDISFFNDGGQPIAVLIANKFNLYI